MSLKTNLSFILCFAITINVNVANADECIVSRGYVVTITAPALTRSCVTTGYTASYTQLIAWNDGSYSTRNMTDVDQLVIGSCCSHITFSEYATGVVTSGRFFGENFVQVYTFSDDNQAYIGNQSSSGGLSRASGQTMLSIGTKGDGQWIECTGTVALLFSPALTATPQLVYATLSTVFDDCTDCLKSC